MAAGDLEVVGDVDPGHVPVGIVLWGVRMGLPSRVAVEHDIESLDDVGDPAVVDLGEDEVEVGIAVEDAGPYDLDRPLRRVEEAKLAADPQPMVLAGASVAKVTCALTGMRTSCAAGQKRSSSGVGASPLLG